MENWALPLRRLPINLRPIWNETVVSYLARLAAANYIPDHHLLNSIGISLPMMPHGVGRNVVRLNNPAQQRLSILSGLDLIKLQNALPDLRLPFPGRPDNRVLPEATIPTIAWRQFRSHGTTIACPDCMARHGITRPVSIWPRETDNLICIKHKFWRDEKLNLDLKFTNAPELIDAHLALRRLNANYGNDHWVLESAVDIARRWFVGTRHIELIHRWLNRARNIGFHRRPTTKKIQDLVLLPESMALAKCMFTKIDHTRDITGREFINVVEQQLRYEFLEGKIYLSDPLGRWVEQARANQSWDTEIKRKLELDIAVQSDPDSIFESDVNDLPN